MEMGTRASTGVSNRPYLLTSFYFLPGFYIYLREMSVAGLITITMVNRNYFAEPLSCAGVYYYTISRSNYRSANLGGHI